MSDTPDPVLGSRAALRVDQTSDALFYRQARLVVHIDAGAIAAVTDRIRRLVLPIDSKWAATGLVERFAVCHDAGEQRRLKDEINRAVLEKAREVQKYLSPNVTTRFGIAAVPDAVYDLCPYTQVEALKIGVVVISYSMFLPYLMLVFETMLQTSQRVDLDRLEARLDGAQQCVQKMQEELEGRFARGLTMLANSRNDLAADLGKVSSALASVQRVD